MTEMLVTFYYFKNTSIFFIYMYGNVILHFINNSTTYIFSTNILPVFINVFILQMSYVIWYCWLLVSTASLNYKHCWNSTTFHPVSNELPHVNVHEYNICTNVQSLSLHTGSRKPAASWENAMILLQNL